MTDALEAVQSELSAAMVPWPDDYVEELSPPAALLLLRQMAMSTLKVVTGGAIALDEDQSQDGGAMTEILNGVAATITGATHALVALGLLPEEAENYTADARVATNDVVNSEPKPEGPVYS